MSRTIPTLLLAWICLSLTGYFLYIDTVESDLHARSKKAAFSAGYEWLSISQQGRDLTLHGSAPDEDALNNAVEAIKNVHGVRIVGYDHTTNELPAQALLETKLSGRDNDGINDTLPLDSSETVDTDKDGIGDHSDTDDDNDGIKDQLDSYLYTHSGISDMDGDGVSDSQDSFPNDFNRWRSESTPTSAIDKNQPAADRCNIDTGISTSYTMIYFKTASTTVDNEGIKLLSNLAAFLNDCPFYKVNITGHTDIRGGQFSNQQLSEQRAAAVEAVLINFGVSHPRIDTSGAAAASPAKDNTTIDGLAGNRRVEVALSR